MKFAVFLKGRLLFNSFFCFFCLRTKRYGSITAINTKIYVLVICVEVIMYVLLYNLLDCIFITNLVSLENRGRVDH